MHTHIYVYKKVKFSRYRPGVAQRVDRGIALLFHDRGTRRGWVVSSTPRPHLPPGKTRYPFYRALGGPQGRSGRAENLISTGIRSRTVQPVVSSYTNWATRPTYVCVYIYTYIYIIILQTLLHVSVLLHHLQGALISNLIYICVCVCVCVCVKFLVQIINNKPYVLV